MGHRVLNHRSVCKGLHGHRYKAEICVEGELVLESGSSEEGMVIDFSISPIFPLVSTMKSRISDSPGLILRFFKRRVVHPQLDCTPLMWRTSVPEFVRVRCPESSSPVIIEELSSWREIESSGCALELAAQMHKTDIKTIRITIA